MRESTELMHSGKKYSRGEINRLSPRTRVSQSEPMDHNFDTLSTTNNMEMGSPVIRTANWGHGALVDNQPKFEKPDYLKKYREKYARIGILGEGAASTHNCSQSSLNSATSLLENDDQNTRLSSDIEPSHVRITSYTLERLRHLNRNANRDKMSSEELNKDDAKKDLTSEITVDKADTYLPTSWSAQSDRLKAKLERYRSTGIIQTLKKSDTAPSSVCNMHEQVNDHELLTGPSENTAEIDNDVGNSAKTAGSTVIENCHKIGIKKTPRNTDIAKTRVNLNLNKTAARDSTCSVTSDHNENMMNDGKRYSSLERSRDIYSTKNVTSLNQDSVNSFQLTDTTNAKPTGDLDKSFRKIMATLNKSDKLSRKCMDPTKRPRKDMTKSPEAVDAISQDSVMSRDDTADQNSSERESKIPNKSKSDSPPLHFPKAAHSYRSYRYTKTLREESCNNNQELHNTTKKSSDINGRGYSNSRTAIPVSRQDVSKMHSDTETDTLSGQKSKCSEKHARQVRRTTDSLAIDREQIRKLMDTSFSDFKKKRETGNVNNVDKSPKGSDHTVPVSVIKKPTPLTTCDRVQKVMSQIQPRDLQSEDSATFSKSVTSELFRTRSKQNGRRSISDLGLCGRPLWTPRTAALLSNPAMRKLLAKSVGVAPNKPDFDKALTGKLRTSLNIDLEVSSRQDNDTVDVEDCKKPGRTSPIRPGYYETSDRNVKSHLPNHSSHTDNNIQDNCSIKTKSRTVSEIISANEIDFVTENRAADRTESRTDTFLETVRKKYTGNRTTRMNTHNKDKVDLNTSAISPSRTANSGNSLADSTRSMKSESKFQMPSFNDFKRGRKTGSPLLNKPFSKSLNHLGPGDVIEEEAICFSSRESKDQVRDEAPGTQKQRNGAISDQNIKRRPSRHSGNGNVSHTRSLIEFSSSSKDDSDRFNRTGGDEICDNYNMTTPRNRKSNTVTSQNSFSDIPQTIMNQYGASADDTSKNAIACHGNSQTEKVQHDSNAAHIKEDLKKDEAGSSWDTPLPISRSTSDVSDLRTEEKRRARTSRDKRNKIRSDPFHDGQRRKSREEVEAILEEVQLSSQTGQRNHGNYAEEKVWDFLDDAKYSSTTSVPSSVSSIPSHDSFVEDDVTERFLRRSSTAPGQCYDLPNQPGLITNMQGPHCGDCSAAVEFRDLPPAALPGDVILCQSCRKRRVERKDTIQEIVDTEISYGKDLNIIKQEFYIRMTKAGLLSDEQLCQIFSNLDELIEINDQFTDKLQDALELALDQGDEDYSSVNIGKLFLAASSMLLAFETYCSNQVEAPMLLEQLERDRELLRIFLHVSQAENSALRRMHLKSFLVVPVQRIMKYPLLLNRVYKLTPNHHPDRERIRKARRKIEQVLEQINSKKGGTGTMRLRAKIPLFRKTTPFENFELKKLAVDKLGWDRNEAHIAMTDKLMCTPHTENLWTKKNRSVKFYSIYCVLVTLGKAPLYELSCDRLQFARPTEIKKAALVLIREKHGKYLVFRKPFYLEQAVITRDVEVPDMFEVLEPGQDTYYFKGEDQTVTDGWFKLLKQYSLDLSIWRKRRNALANIMIQGVSESSDQPS